MSLALPHLNIPSLQQAMDAERTKQGMTWAALALKVHVSVPTMRSMNERGNIEADAVVLILQWLRRRCDDFVIRPSRHKARQNTGKAVPMPPLYARFDTIKLHAALDRARQTRRLSWDDVANELGVSTGVIARFTKGGRTNANLMIAAADWAGEPVEALLQPSRPTLGYARMDAKARGKK